MKGSKAGLADLKRLHRQLAERREAEAAERAARRAERGRAAQAGRAAEDELQSFRRAMGAVTPIKPPARVVHAAPAPRDEALPMRRAAATGEPAAPRPADAGVSDGGDVAHLLSENGTAFVRADAAPDTARRLRRGQWRAGAELDLHGLRVEQARHALLSFLDECLEHGIRCVRVVHGKGYGSQGLQPVLKDKARAWLVQKEDVVAFAEAPEREGGSGALLVLLRQAAARR